MRILVTGSGGFIGSHLARLLVDAEGIARVTSLDALTYAGNVKNLADLKTHARHRFVRGDIADSGLVDRLFEEGRFDAVLNLAAEGHVDRARLEARRRF